MTVALGVSSLLVQRFSYKLSLAITQFIRVSCLHPIRFSWQGHAPGSDIQFGWINSNGCQQDRLTAEVKRLSAELCWMDKAAGCQVRVWTIQPWRNSSIAWMQSWASYSSYSSFVEGWIRHLQKHLERSATSTVLWSGHLSWKHHCDFIDRSCQSLSVACGHASPAFWEKAWLSMKAL